MLKTTHIAAGVSLCTIAAAALGINPTGVFLGSSALGAVISDADHPRSSINSKFLIFKNKIGLTITYLLAAILLYLYGKDYFDYKILFYFIPILLAVAFSHHRGITHSLSFLVVSYFLAFAVQVQYGVPVALPFSLGVASHIFLDCFNPQGCELFAPFSDKNYSFPLTISTGSIPEYVLMAISFFYLVNRFIYPISRLF